MNNVFHSRDRHYGYLYDVEGNLILITPRRGLTQHRTTRCRRKVARILLGRQVTMLPLPLGRQRDGAGVAV